MKLYELAYLISPELKEEEAKIFYDKISSLLTKEGEVLKSQSPQKTGLAYPIKNKNEAFFADFEFELEVENLETLKKELEKEKDILRFLLINKEVENQKQKKTKRFKKSEKGAPLPKTKINLEDLENEVEKIIGKETE